jgi:hypothetical protein
MAPFDAKAHSPTSNEGFSWAYVSMIEIKACSQSTEVPPCVLPVWSNVDEHPLSHWLLPKIRTSFLLQH